MPYTDKLKQKAANQKWLAKQDRYSKWYNLKRKFNLSKEQWISLRDAQNSCCALCGIHESKVRYKTLVVDHCHNTNKIRGLLCVICNRYVVSRVDIDPDYIKRLAKYVALEPRVQESN